MKPITLLILDGWGVSSEKQGNAILATKTPNYDILQSQFLFTELSASGQEVGLPPGLMGNSEVGHLNIGAGRVVIQKLTQISQTIIDGSFYKNPAFTAALDFLRSQKYSKEAKVHIFGLVSDGCVHSSPDHLDGLLELIRKENISNFVVHPILDGRDTPPRSALRFMRELESKLSKLGGRIGVVCGRYYAMDRDNRWERIEKYWRALVLNEGLRADSAVKAVEMAYERDENDEFVLPTLVSESSVKDGDVMICFNFRPDRVRQISRAMTTKEFDFFNRPFVPDIFYVCMTEYDSSLKLPVAFSPEQLPSQDMESTLPQLLSCHKIRQLHLAETEKYAHVTYFFNGGKEQANEGEERILIPSLKVATYDKAPAMQTPKVCEMACESIRKSDYPFMVINFANPDMVGHTGFMEAAVQAVNSVDDAFGNLLEATKEANGTLVITADHGNVEQMIDLRTGEAHTAHTTNPVPFIVADFSGRVTANQLARGGSLADIAPTLLKIMGFEKPKEMTGKSLLTDK